MGPEGGPDRAEVPGGPAHGADGKPRSARHPAAAANATDVADLDGLVFGRTPEQAFVPQTLHRHTKQAWKDAGLTAEWQADGMLPPGLHDARHHCLTHWGRVWDVGRLHQASGHSDIRQTQRYLHVPPDRDAEDAARLDAYLGAM